jgi:titin
VEPLEPRWQPTTFLVTSTDDSGPGTLRQAILDANAAAGSNTIAFALDQGAQTIVPTSALPTIAQPVTIDATTQPGFAGTPVIEIDGSQAGTQANGLRITAGGTTVRGLVIDHFGQTGIVLLTNGNDVIQGNYIGTDITGTTAQGNGLGVEIDTASNLIAGNVIAGNRVDGLRILGSGATANVLEGNFIGTDATGTTGLGNTLNGIVITGPGNTIGGTDSGAGNIIAGNGQQGIYVNGTGATGNIIQGNYIGSDVNGTAEISNGLRGITVANGASSNLIGGTDPGAGNLLSGNRQNGLELTGAGTSGNLVQGNLVGTDVTGTSALPNHLRGVGISYGAASNTIGGTTAAARNIISGNMQNGVLLDASTDSNVVQGNFIGTDITGTSAVPNQQEGVLLGKTSTAGPITNNLIGGTDAGAGNVISGNIGPGVRIKDDQTSGNLVQGNFVGTDATGSVALPNGSQGVLILQGASGNIIGGTDPGAGNVISGNMQEGVLIKDNGTSGNVVAGNLIGTDVTGTLALGNGSHGVSIINTSSNNTIGGTDAGAGNVIAYNGGIGVRIGTNVRDLCVGNAIRGNAIYGNAGIGIDLGSDGVTPNHDGGGATGPNELQNYPVLTSAVADSGGVTIAGTLNGAANTVYVLEFFANSALDPSGYGQGEVFLGTWTVTTDADGNASFTASFAAAVAEDQFITATATDPDNNTSEFSAGLEVQGS